MAYIHVYQGNPTANSTDGTQVSEGTGAVAITFTLNASNNEEGTPMKLAVWCESGYQITSAGVTVTMANTFTLGFKETADAPEFIRFVFARGTKGTVSLTLNGLYYIDVNRGTNRGKAGLPRK